MTIYSCGLSSEDLATLGLKADVLLKGRDVSYTSVNSAFDWEVPSELTTSNEVHNYGDSYNVDFEKHILREGDEVILLAYLPYITVHKLKKDGVKVTLIANEENLTVLE